MFIKIFKVYLLLQIKMVVTILNDNNIKILSLLQVYAGVGVEIGE